MPDSLWLKHEPSAPSLVACDVRRPTYDDFSPHLTHNIFCKSTLAVCPDAGSKLSLASISTHVSPSRVAAAIAASRRLVFPDEAPPQISVRHPRGMPAPVIASTSFTPVEIISGRGRTSSLDAGRTSASRSDPAICFSSAARFSWNSCNPAGNCRDHADKEGAIFSGEADMETSRQK